MDTTNNSNQENIKPNENGVSDAVGTGRDTSTFGNPKTVCVHSFPGAPEPAKRDGGPCDYDANVLDEEFILIPSPDDSTVLVQGASDWRMGEDISSNTEGGACLVPDAAHGVSSEASSNFGNRSREEYDMGSSKSTNVPSELAPNSDSLSAEGANTGHTASVVADSASLGLGNGVHEEKISEDVDLLPQETQDEVCQPVKRNEDDPSNALILSSNGLDDIQNGTSNEPDTSHKASFTSENLSQEDALSTLKSLKNFSSRSIDWLVQKTEGAVPLLIVSGEEVVLRSRDLLLESKSFVGVIGPPGAGKSSLCNTIVHCQHNIEPRIFFEPSDSMKTFTKGLWILSPAAKRLFPNDSDWEVLDMEGFQFKSEVCWKLAMVLSVLAEVVIFCNRNPRCDVLFEAADAFAKGANLCRKLSMSPITKQVFVQVSNAYYKNPEKLNSVVNQVKDILQNPEISIAAFVIPEVDVPMREVPFHPEVVRATKEHLTSKFDFAKDSQAAAAKATQLNMLLEAFNKHDFSKCDKLGLQFLKMDCDRIHKQALAEHREKHGKLAAEKKVTSVDTTFENFISDVDWSLELNFEDSQFFLDKYAEKVKKWYPHKSRFQAVPAVYRRYYDNKLAELKAKLEAEEFARIAEEAKKKAEEAKVLADRQREEARQIVEEAQKAKEAAEEERRQAMEEAEIARQNISRAKLEAEEAKKKAEEAKVLAHRLREEARQIVEAAQKAKEDAEAERRQAVEDAERARKELEAIEADRIKREKEAKEADRIKREKEAEEAARLARVAEIAENKAAFRRMVIAAIETGKETLLRHISKLEDDKRPLYDDSLFDNWCTYIDMDSVEDFARQKDLCITGDWTPFETFFEAQKNALKDKWQKQIESAKWKAPLKAMGELKCKGGHTLAPDDVFCGLCDGKGKMFWVDGPHSVCICQECNDIQKISELICAVCNQDALCTVRPSDYMP